MITLAVIAAPSALLGLLLEVRERRMPALTAGLDGGVVICLAALALRLGDAI